MRESKVASCASSVLVVSRSIELEEALRDYDEKAYPSRNGEPVNVSIQIYIEDMVPTEEHPMHYSVTMYFRQFWFDYRLATTTEGDEHNEHNLDMNTLGWEFSQIIWTPDLYFPLGKYGKRHTLVEPNVLVRLRHDGFVFFSQRLTIITFCPMNLRNYPFDKQKCEFPVESYAYSHTDLQLHWNNMSGGPIFSPEEKNMGEFTFDGYSYEKRIVDYGLESHYDNLIVIFHFSRNVNYFVLHMYTPCVLIVMLSWVGFWINYRSIPARVALGITTVLTMGTLGNNIRTTAPAVNYTKSIDYYVIICFIYVFSALIEFAFVGVTDLHWKKKERKREDEIDYKRQTSHGDDAFDGPEAMETEEEKKQMNLGVVRNGARCVDSSRFVNKKPRRVGISSPVTEPLEETFQGDVKKKKRSIGEKMTRKFFEIHERNENIHFIDKWSRFLFPLSFFIGNVIYFSLCLTKA